MKQLFFEILKNKQTIFDLIFDTNENPRNIFKIHNWFWNFFIPHLLLWTGAENTSKTQHFLCNKNTLENPPIQILNGLYYIYTKGERQTRGKGGQK